MGGRTRWMDVGWVLFTNLFLLAGVLAWGWPPGNVFVLFWVENVILGVVTAVRIATAEGVDPSGKASRPRWVTTGFFVMHYGMFALGHGVFVMIIALLIGLQYGFWTLAMPALLIALRYVVDLASNWFLDDRRRSVTPDQTFWSPYPRLIVLHVATIAGFFAVSTRVGTTNRSGPLIGLLDWLAGHGIELSSGAFVVGVLLVIKTFADLLALSGRRIIGSSG
ncbi:DUF6498-containing protein [Micropruina sp.]|uniref:DUF6498-containing protein n=1 Tax=Micropruina sp. TaxID=2737536 RepID=UPI0039E53D50